MVWFSMPHHRRGGDVPVRRRHSRRMVDDAAGDLRLSWRCVRPDWAIGDTQRKLPAVPAPPRPATTVKRGTVFRDDDIGYLTWIDEHPIRFVLNCERHPRPGYLMVLGGGVVPCSVSAIVARTTDEDLAVAACPRLRKRLRQTPSKQS